MIDNPKGSFLRIHRSILLVLLLVTSIAVSLYFGSLKPKAIRASIVSSPLEFSIELNKTDFQQGEYIPINLTLRNISNKTITLMWGSYSLEWRQTIVLDFYVVDANGTIVYQWFHEHGALMSSKTKILNPSEQWTNFFYWHQKYNYPQDDILVPKGTYSVFGHTRKMGLTIDNQTRWIELETPSLTFTIQ